MHANSPQELHQLLAAAVSNGDLDTYLALYEPGAALVKQAGGVANGREAISAEIAAFLSVRGRLRITTSNVVTAGEIALMHSLGAFSGVAPDGSPIEVPEHPAVEVARRQADGTWLFVVNNPWAGA